MKRKPASIVLSQATRELDAHIYIRLARVVQSPTYRPSTDLAAVMSQIKLTAVYFIEYDNWIVGFISWQTEPDNPLSIGYIREFGVHPEYRGHGIGTSALSWALGAFRALGMHMACLTIRPDNPAITLFRRFNFFEVDYLDDYMETGVPRIVMALT